jgi:hypothetical protein
MQAALGISKRFRHILFSKHAFTTKKDRSIVLFHGDVPLDTAFTNISMRETHFVRTGIPII